MKKIINHSAVEKALQTLGLNQARIAERLEVSRETISKWMKGTAFPRPDKLLKLGMLLSLKFSELVSEENPLQPQPAFRFRGSIKERPEDYEHARHIGELLEQLVPYLPDRHFENPPTLRNPSCDHDYLEALCLNLRQDMNLTENDPMTLTSLLQKARSLGMILIPVLWGKKDIRENALRIYLPKSQTTWIFLNLDSSSCDFLFWFIHELGHVYAPALSGDEAERFSDLFAQHLLYPARRVQCFYDRNADFGSPVAHVHQIIEEADALKISPVAVLKALEDYADRHRCKQIFTSKFTPYPLFQKYIRKQSTIAETYFGQSQINPSVYLEKSKEIFGADFFQAMSSLKKNRPVSGSIFQEITQMSLLDSRTVWEAL